MVTINHWIARLLIGLILGLVIGLVIYGLSSSTTSLDTILETTNPGQATAIIEKTSLPEASANTASPQPTIPTSGSPDEYLKINGQALDYKHQTVYLRGSNFNNYTALKIRTDTVNWGNGNTDDINFTEADYKRLSELGGNHVRWGMSFNWYKDDRLNFFQVLDQHIAWARKYDLWLVPLLFTFPDDCYEGYTYQCPYWKDAGLQQEVLDFWVDVASHYKNEPVVAGYDLLNEPTPPNPDGARAWFALAQKMRDAISDVDPNHLVFIEFDSSGRYLPELEGNNIVYSTHIYTPFAITHAEAATEITYPGSILENNSLIWWDKDALAGNGDARANLRTRYAIDWAAENHVPMYIGEFGTRGWVEGYLTYLGDLFDLFNSWQLHYAHFAWRAPTYEGFGIYPERDSFIPWSEEREALVESKLAGSFKPSFYETTSITNTLTTITCRMPDLCLSYSIFGD